MHGGTYRTQFASIFTILKSVTEDTISISIIPKWQFLSDSDGVCSWWKMSFLLIKIIDGKCVLRGVASQRQERMWWGTHGPHMIVHLAKVSILLYHENVNLLLVVICTNCHWQEWNFLFQWMAAKGSFSFSPLREWKK